MTPTPADDVVAALAEARAEIARRDEKIRRQADHITGLLDAFSNAKRTIRDLKTKVRNQTSGETRDIDQLIKCNLRIESQREEIDRLRANPPAGLSAEGIDRVKKRLVESFKRTCTDGADEELNHGHRMWLAAVGDFHAHLRAALRDAREGR